MFVLEINAESARKVYDYSTRFCVLPFENYERKPL